MKIGDFVFSDRHRDPYLAVRYEGDGTDLTFPDAVGRDYEIATCFGYSKMNPPTALIFPDGVTAIRMESFRFCRSLVCVEIGKNVRSIGAGGLQRLLKAERA